MDAYPTPGTVVAGRYRIDALLGEGGMGAVFRATELAANLSVALKFPAPEMRARPGMASRFANEASAASRIACEHVVQIFGVETTESGSPFIVMELLNGRDLDAIVEKESPLLPARAVHFTLQILRALQVAHAAGVVHRDLKPSNALVIERDGEPDYVKLIDFGITKIIGDDKGLTKTSTTLGTPAYMAPEQAKSAKAADARSDLYSVGVILYELLTRRRPFEGESQNEVVIKICTEPPMPLRSLRGDLPAGLVAAVEHALVKAPLGRFPTAQAFAAALEPFADERSKGVLARIHSGAAMAPAAALALAPTPMADEPPVRKPSGTAMMDESLLPAEMQAALAAAPAPAIGMAPAHVVVAPMGAEAPVNGREGAGKTVVGDVAPAPFGSTAVGSPSPMMDAGAPVGMGVSAAPVAVPPAVPYVPGAPISAQDSERGGGGGRGLLFGVLGLLAVGLIGGGLYFAFRGGSGGSTSSGGSGGGNVSIDNDDGSGGHKKKKTKKNEETGVEEPEPEPDAPGTATTTKPNTTATTRPTTTGTATTTTTTTAPTTLPSTLPSTTVTAPTTVPSTTTTAPPTTTVPTTVPTTIPSTLPTGWPRRPNPTTTTTPTTTPTTVPTTIPTTAPTGTGRKPKFGGG
jgi:serine/threonine-protein kinase